MGWGSAVLNRVIEELSLIRWHVAGDPRKWRSKLCRLLGEEHFQNRSVVLSGGGRRSSESIREFFQTNMPLELLVHSSRGGMPEAGGGSKWWGHSCFSFRFSWWLWCVFPVWEPLLQTFLFIILRLFLLSESGIVNFFYVRMVFGLILINSTSFGTQGLLWQDWMLGLFTTPSPRWEGLGSQRISSPFPPSWGMFLRIPPWCSLITGFW